MRKKSLFVSPLLNIKSVPSALVIDCYSLHIHEVNGGKIDYNFAAVLLIEYAKLNLKLPNLFS